MRELYHKEKIPRKGVYVRKTWWYLNLNSCVQIDPVNIAENSQIKLRNSRQIEKGNNPWTESIKKQKTFWKFGWKKPKLEWGIVVMLFPQEFLVFRAELSSQQETEKNYVTVAHRSYLTDEPSQLITRQLHLR